MTSILSGGVPDRPRSVALWVLVALLGSAAGAPLAAKPESPPRSSPFYGSGKVLKPKFEDLVRRADLIVVGKVIQIGGIAHAGPSKHRPGSRKYTYWEDSYALLRVEEIVKGKAEKSTVKVAFHSDLEGDRTSYQAGKKYIVFLLKPSKYPDAYTTAHFHYGQYRINDEGKAEKVADPSEISKPAGTVIDNIRKAMGPPGKGR